MRSQDTTSYYHFGAGGSINGTFIVNQNMYGQPEMDYAPTIGGNVFIAAGYNFSQRYGLRIEPGLSWQGQSYDDNQTIEGVTYATTRDINLNYFKVPILFRFTPGAGNNKFHLMAGPELAFLMSADQEYLRDGEPAPPFYSDEAGMMINPSQEDIKDRYNGMDLGLVIDAGIDIKLSESLFLNLGARLTYGFLDMNADEWQLKNMSGEYNASHNFTGGITVGINWWSATK